MTREQMAGAERVREAANGLVNACERQAGPRTLRQRYNDTVAEGVPDWAQELLNRLK